jgi:hypothetical protein
MFRGDVGERFRIRFSRPAVAFWRALHPVPPPRFSVFAATSVAEPFKDIHHGK